jgi:hypothetical protein
MFLVVIKGFKRSIDSGLGMHVMNAYYVIWIAAIYLHFEYGPPAAPLASVDSIIKTAAASHGIHFVPFWWKNWRPTVWADAEIHSDDFL